MPAPPEAWLPLRRPGPGRPSVLCFPHAGAGITPYVPWAARLPGIDVCPVLPPGRGTRFGEAVHDDLDELLDDLLGAVGPPPAPFVLYGHSLGALTAFELARRLRAAGHPPPRALVVSGRAAPQLADVLPRLHDLPDDALVESLRRMGGTSEEILAEPELRALVVRVMRADFTLHERYRHRPGPPLAVPLVALGSDRDPRASVPAIEAWRAQTSAGFRSVVVPGGHFALVEEPTPVLDAITEALADAPAPEAARP